MKKSLKIAISLLLTLSMFACCVTISADTSPTITVGTTEATPCEDATVTITANNFSSVAGMDLKVNLGDLSISGSEVESNDITLEKNSNYTVKNNQLRIIDAFVGSDKKTSFTISFKVSGATKGDHTISLTNSQFANENEEFISPSLNSGKLTIKDYEPEKVDDPAPTTEETTIETNIPSGCFIPYGGVVYNGNQYIIKNPDGTFTGNGADVTVRYFKLPENDKPLTTFGVSSHAGDPSAEDDKDKDAIQFGSYATDWDKGDEFGTLLIIGDFAKFKKKYQANSKYDTNEKIFKQFVDLYKDTIEDKYGPGGESEEENYEENRYMKVSVDTNEYIYITRVTQKKFMWFGEASTAVSSQMQYALRVYNINKDKNYTAVGYKHSDNNYEFSTTNKSVKWSDFN